MPDRRRTGTLIGLGLLGAGGIMLLQRHSSPAPAPAPQPAPAPLPVVVPPGTSSGGVPPAPRPAPAPAPKPVAPLARAAVALTYFQVRALNGKVLLRTSNKGQALAFATATRVAGTSVWLEGGRAAIYVVPGRIATRRTYVPPKPAGSIVAAKGAAAPGFRF